MEQKKILGSYMTMDGRELTYYSEYDHDDGWYVTQYTKGEKQYVEVASHSIINLLLLHIENLETLAWEEAMGEDL